MSVSLLVLLVFSSAFAASQKTSKPAPTPPPPTPGPNDPARCGPKPGGGSYGNCYAYSTDKTFVECNKTTNRCYCLDSFSGNASPNNPCDCVEPKTVFIETDLILGGWGNLDSFGLGTPHCIDLPTLLAIDAAETRRQKHISAVQKFFSFMIGDLPTMILMPGGEQRLTDIVSPTVRSRISPAGEFDGFEGVIEYFYGFVANPSFRVISIDFRSLAASGNTVAAKANVFLNNSRFALTGGHPPQYWNLTTFAFFTFNNNDLIESIDVSVPNLGAILDIPDTQPGAAQIRQGIINNTCLLMLAPQPANPLTGAPALPNGYCGNFPIWTGNNPLERIANCQQVLSAIPYGTRYRNNANSFACRSLHAILIPFRPNPHCFHAGPDGGGRCVDVPYSDYYLKDY